MKPLILTGIDIGSNTIKTLVVMKRPGEENFEVLAQINEASMGVRKGVVVNPDEVSVKIRSTLEQVAKISNQNIDSASVNIGGSHIVVINSRGGVAVSRADQTVSQEDIDRVIEAAQAVSLGKNQEILDVFPKEFIVDGQDGVKEPLGMTGIRLEAEILAVCAFSPYVKSLTNAVLDSGIQIDDIIASPLASARSVLTPRQKELGVAVLDIGAGTADLAVFEERDLIHSAVFSLGSSRITNDIAIGLRTGIDMAERIKKEFGTCIIEKRKGGKKKKIEISQNGSSVVFTREELVHIIKARVCEIFDEVNKELEKVSRKGLLPAGLVITGGGAKLPKLVELAKKQMELPCRIGIPQNFIGLAEDPSLATVCGLVQTEADFKPEKVHYFGRKIVDKLKRVFRIFIP